MDFVVQFVHAKFLIGIGAALAPRITCLVYAQGQVPRHFTSAHLNPYLQILTFKSEASAHVRCREYALRPRQDAHYMTCCAASGAPKHQRHDDVHDEAHVAFNLGSIWLS